MRKYIFIFTLITMAFFSTSAEASLPYYNADIGYTIWLPKDWSKVPDSDLKSVHASGKPFSVRGMQPDWQAGYCGSAEGGACGLYVEVKHGRKMHAADISNFNRFIVMSMRRSIRDQARLPNAPSLTLKNATYIPEKKTLRLETEVVQRGETQLSLTYIVYTRKGMLTFVGHVAPDDEKAKAIIDKAVFSLYLDDKIRY